MDMTDEAVVCTCLDLTVNDIREAVRAGAQTLEDVQRINDAGTICGACVDDVQEIIDDELDRMEAEQ